MSPNFHRALSIRFLRLELASGTMSIPVTSLVQSWISMRILIKKWAVVEEFECFGSNFGEESLPFFCITTASERLKNSDKSET